MAYKLGKQELAAEDIKDGSIPYSKLSDATHLTIDNKADKLALESEVAARTAKDSSLDTDVAGLSTIIGTKADKSELDSKADKSALDAKANITDLDSKANVADLATKADKSDLDAKANIADMVSAETLASKADKSDLATKANVSDLALKADKADLDAKANTADLANKADKSELNEKADQMALEEAQSELQFSIDTLAGHTYSKAHINNALELKANKSDIDAISFDGYSKADVDTKLSLKASQAAFDTHVADTYNKTDVDTKLALKADASSIGAKIELVSTDDGSNPGGKRLKADGADFKLGRFAIFDDAITTTEIRDHTIKPINLHKDTLDLMGDSIKLVATDNTDNPGGVKLSVDGVEKKLGRWAIFGNAITSMEVRDGTLAPFNMHADTLARMPVQDKLVLSMEPGFSHDQYDYPLTALKSGDTVTISGIARTATLGVIISTLPEGWRPLHNVYSPSTVDGGVGFSVVNPEGELKVSGSGPTNWLMVNTTYSIT